MASTNVPEEHTEGVYVDRRVVGAAQQFGRHVNWRTYYAARHHCLRLAETQVSQFAPVAVIQLQEMYFDLFLRHTLPKHFLA